MLRRIILITMILFTTSGIAEPLEQFAQILDMAEPTKLWIDKLQPNSPIDTKQVITNHLLVNSATHNIPLELLVGIITVESRFNPKAVSSHGAKGITQVMPQYHKAKIKGRDIFDPRVGIEVGSLIFRDCLNKYHGNHNRALSCYSGSSGQQAIKYQQKVLTETKHFISHTTLLTKYSKPTMALSDY